MDYFTEEDSYWFENVKQYPSEFEIKIDNDCIWVEADNVDGITECVYTFNSYGYYFIYALLKHMGINAEYC